MGEISIGIDLGTSNSLVGAVVNDKLIIYSDPARSDKLMPSMVAFTEAGIQVGHTAKRILHNAPESIAYDAKRLFEATYAEAKEMQQASNWPFELLERHVVQHGQLFNCVKIGVKVAGEKHEFYPEEISAHVIKKLRSNAEHWLEQKVSSVVIAVPANFTTGMKEATRNAAVIAGFEPTKVTIVHEPTAAAFAYGVHSGANHRRVLVYDLGAGTFDVTLLRIENQCYVVEATSGAQNIGGQDFTNKMTLEIKDALELLHSVILTPAQIQKVNRDCEAAKIDLTGTRFVTVTVEGVLPGNKNYVHKFERELFELINKDRFEETIQVVKTVLEMKQLSPEEIHDVLLVGGSSRIPRIKALLTGIFPGASFKGMNPDEIVCEGAARLANLYATTGGDEFSTREVLDVASNNFGIEVIGDKVCPIIEWNSRLPRIVTKKFTNAKANQTVIPISVYEGRGLETKKNRLVGTFNVDGLPEKSEVGEIKIKVQFILNNEGILDVKATVGTSSFGKTILVPKKLNSSAIKILTEKAERQERGEFRQQVFELLDEERTDEPADIEVIPTSNEPQHGCPIDDEATMEEGS